MDKKIMTIVAVIAVVAVVAVAAFVLMQPKATPDDPGDDDKKYDITSRLLVFGNANNDNYLDSSDVQFIQSIVDKKSNWNSKANPLADTNGDGSITSDDVALLQKFLKGESAKMYYLNWYGEKCSINYPLSGAISGFNAQCIDIAIIAGVYDDFLGLAENESYISNLSKDWYPGAAAKLKSVRGEGYNFNLQSLLAIKTKVVLADASWLHSDFISEAKKADPSMNLIQLPINKVATTNVGNVDWTHTIITLGAMYNNQDITKEYIQYITEIEDKISENLSAIKAKYGSETFVIAYMPSSETTTDVDFYAERFNEQYGDVMNLMRLPLTDIIDVKDAGEGWSPGYKIEDIISAKPSVIFVETWNLINAKSEQDYLDTMTTMVNYFKASDAYKNNRVISICYELYGTVPGISGMVAVAGLLWPELFSEQEGIDILNEYFSKFTFLKDFDVSEHIGYLPEKWGATA